MSDTNDSFAPDNPPSRAAGDDATRSSEDRTKAVFATFNVLHGRVANGPVDLDAYAEAVVALGADVVGLQEIDKGMLRTKRADMAKLAGRRAGMAHYFAKAFRRLDLGQYGIALLSKGPMTSERIALPRFTRKNEQRVAIESRVVLAGTEWTVFNTHFSLDEAESEAQLKVLLARASLVDGPVVLMGDFNRFPDQVEPLVGADWQVGQTGPTWPSWGPEKRIDYILVRNAVIESVDVRVMPVSDHCALIATVSA